MVFSTLYSSKFCIPQAVWVIRVSISMGKERICVGRSCSVVRSDERLIPDVSTGGSNIAPKKDRRPNPATITMIVTTPIIKIVFFVRLIWFVFLFPLTKSL